MNRIQEKLYGALLLALCMIPVSVLASPGGTDANGGHYEHSTGLYHYHHGYPAHQHENGICPYTNKKWELKIPERPPTLIEWEKQKHSSDDVAAIDNETPDNDDWKKTETSAEPAASHTSGAASAALPVAAAAGSAAVLGGAYAAFRGKRKKKGESVPEVTSERETSAVSEPEDSSPEAVIPEGTVIGDDGLPWEQAAYEREQAKKQKQTGSTEVPTNFAEPRWGKLYSFCLDADGEEIHTMDCELAFIQVNAADRNCPKKDCPKCHPVRPDLSWFEEYQKRKAAWNAAHSSGRSE